MAPAVVTPRERVQVLLEHYNDVVRGLRDGRSDQDGVVGMCRAWNSPAYRQLERLRLELREADRRLYRALLGRYLWAQTTPRRVCPFCHDTLRQRSEHWPPHSGPDFHRHGRRHVATVVRPLTIVSDEIDEALVERALDWITDHWQGDPSLPRDLLAILHREDVGGRSDAREPALT